MKRTYKEDVKLPSEEEVVNERERLQYRKEYKKVFRSTVVILIVVAAITVLIAMLFVPVLKVRGTSMEPTLYDGDIITLFKLGDIDRGDVCGFYWQNKLLLKRVIGLPGDVINIDDDGNVSVNGKVIDEPYITEKSIGICNISLPYQVPEGRYFMMGDHRSTSVDSRSSTIGCIEKEQIVGKVFVRVWPFNRVSFLK